MNWNKIKNNLIGAKGLASIGFSDIIGVSLSSLFWFYLASLIDTDKFGQIHYFLSFAGTAYTIALVATQTVITVYVSKNLKLESTLYFISLSIGSIASIIVFSIIYRLDVSLLIFGFIINDLAIAYLLGKKQYLQHAKYIILQKLFVLIFCIGLFYIFGPDAIIYGLFFSYLHFVIVIFKRFRESKIKLSLLRPRIGFIINNYAISLAGLFRNHLDKLIIGQIFGFSILGNYALAVQMFAILMIFSNIVEKYILPEDASGNYNRKLKKLAIGFSVLIAIFGISILPSVIQIFFPKYSESVEIIRIMSLGVISATVGKIYASKLLATEKSRHVVTGRWISAVVMIVGIIILGSVFGSIGLAISYVLSTTTAVIYMIATDNLKIKK